MKRSDMIRLIENNFTGEIREFAEDILFLVEEAGMLPPKAFFVDDTIEGMLHKWEPEDDSDNYCAIS